MILRALAVLVLVLLAAQPRPAAAQAAEVWVQVEAQPTLAEAEDRARAYSAMFPDTHGFRLRSGWYAVMLGPYSPAEAEARLDSLRREGLIPRDSFIAFTRDFGEAYWSPRGQQTQPAIVPPGPETAPAAEPPPEDETRAEARDSEALLGEAQRKELQVALQWFGFYQGGIDGAFGPGTRNAMVAWQEAQALEATGVLTTRQRRALTEAWAAETATFGFAEVVEAEAGITVTLPLGLVEFDHYEPPFVHFRARSDAAPQIVLISQPGDQAAFSGLYDILQSLESVPLDGPREKDDRRFRIRGTSATTDTTVFAEYRNGMIKGWMLISTPAEAGRDARILRAIEDSFVTDPTRALDPGRVDMAAETRAGLLAGLEVRKPRLSRTGFFVTADGLVATTVEAVEGCGRITIDRTTDAEVTLTDAASGLALLRPQAPLAPRAVAGFAAAPGRPGSEITVPGYAYEDRLPAPVLTFGTFEEGTGLNGEAGRARLSLQSLPGDAGGAVLDGTGAVVGMLLPASLQEGRQLPAGTAFALWGSEITRLLAGTGTPPQMATASAPLAPARLAETATAMTALVSCWD